MRIEIRPDLSLLIVVPCGTREDQWLTFVLSKRQWIEHKLKISVRQWHQAGAVDFPSTIDLLCKQQQFPVSHSTGTQNKAVLVAGSLNLVSRNASEKQQFQNLRRWLMAQAREEFLMRMDRISKATGLEWNKLSIRGQKTRWGSCSAQGNISLNFKLLFLSPDLVNYVILHELIHTREMNHSHRFWTLMKRFDAGFEQHRRELKRAGQLLPGWTAKL